MGMELPAGEVPALPAAASNIYIQSLSYSDKRSVSFRGRAEFFYVLKSVAGLNGWRFKWILNGFSSTTLYPR